MNPTEYGQRRPRVAELGTIGTELVQQALRHYHATLGAKS